MTKCDKNFCELNPKIIKKFSMFFYAKPPYLPVNAELSKRASKMAIPPIYKTFWISKNPKNPIQAVWEDSKKRKQYLYNETWNTKQKEKKYDRMRDFVARLPTFWRKVLIDLNNNVKDSKTRTIAHMFLIMKETHIRVGNEKYFNDNESVGLTTLKKEHVTFVKGNVVLKFKGKSGIYHEKIIKDPRIVNFLKQITKGISKSMWLFVNENNVRINSGDMNSYLKTKMSNSKDHTFSVKDFRTIAANTIFIDYLKKNHGKMTAKQNVTNSLKHTAIKLGHNTGTTKKSYVSNKYIEEYTKNPEKFIKQSTKKILKSI